jgi:hypothetical protein
MGLDEIERIATKDGNINVPGIVTIDKHLVSIPHSPEVLRVESLKYHEVLYLL